MRKTLLTFMVVFLFSCSSTKFKETTTQEQQIKVVYIDSSKTTVAKLQQQIEALSSQNFTMIVKDTFYKLDSIYMPSTIKYIYYSSNQSTKTDSKSDIITVQNNVKKDSSAITKTETVVKEKKSTNFFSLFSIIILLLLLAGFFVYQYFLKSRI